MKVKVTTMHSDDPLVSKVIKKMESEGTTWDLSEYFAPIEKRLKKLEATWPQVTTEV